jgi:hypothetical protein
MTREVSSAEPDKLFGYADAASRMDDNLISESVQLGAKLRQFEQECTEPCRVDVGHLSAALADYRRADEEILGWVRAVGREFEAADSWWSGWGVLPGVPLKWSPVRSTLLSTLPALTAVAILRKLRVPDWLERIIDSVPWSRQEPRLEPQSPLRPTIRKWEKRDDSEEDDPKKFYLEDYVEYDQERLPWPAPPKGKKPKESCVHWARLRRHSLLPPEERAEERADADLPSIGDYRDYVEGVGADQFLKIFRGRTVWLSVDEALGDLTRIRALQPGTVVVWKRDHPYLKGTDGEFAGHVAVIEAVEPDCIWFSQANVPANERVKRYSGHELLNLHFIPPWAKPLSVEELREKSEGI